MIVPVGQHPQQREQLGSPLHLVDHDRAAQLTEGGEGFVEPRQADRVLKVKVVGALHRHQLARQRGLAALTRPEQGHNGRTGEGSPKGSQAIGTGKHGARPAIALKFLRTLQEFQG